MDEEFEEQDSGGGGGGEGAPAWMATFSDMSTLLLTFFVLLLSFATMDVKKFQDALGSIQRALGFMPTGTGLFQHTMKPTFMKPPMANAVRSQASRLIEEELNEMVAMKGLEEDVEVKNTKRGVVLRVKGRLFFNSGTAEIKPEAYPILDRIAEMIKKFPGRVSIEGHTDNVPIRGGPFKSNWELSAARAYAALKYLQSKGVDIRKINIAGFADTRPIASNDTPEGREKNRRVEFVFYEEPSSSSPINVLNEPLTK